MFVVAQIAGQAETAVKLDPEWILEVVWYSVLIVAGLALIFISVLGQKRLQRASGDSIIKIKDLFSLQTNLVGLFAILGLLLIGAVLFMRFSDYRDKLKASASKNAELTTQIASERKLRESFVDEFKAVSVEFALEFPDEALPTDLSKVNVTAEVTQADGRKEKWEIMARTGPGGIRASVRGLHPGDFVTLRAKDGQRTWRSAPFAVPSVAIEMKGE